MENLKQLSLFTSTHDAALKVILNATRLAMLAGSRLPAPLLRDLKRTEASVNLFRLGCRLFNVIDSTDDIVSDRKKPRSLLWTTSIISDWGADLCEWGVLLCKLGVIRVSEDKIDLLSKVLSLYTVLNVLAALRPEARRTTAGYKYMSECGKSGASCHAPRARVCVCVCCEHK
eukprot:m51a1_g9624 hypothetical protein (173) ;mRNA; r:1110298-1111090